MALAAMGTDEQRGYGGLKRFEEKAQLEQTDGIFALSDHVAPGCRHYFRTKRPDLNLPVIGVEGQAFGNYMQPQLPSVAFDSIEMGRRAAQDLFEQLESKTASEVKAHYLIQPTLLEPSTGQEPSTDIRMRIINPRQVPGTPGTLLGGQQAADSARRSEFV